MDETMNFERVFTEEKGVVRPDGNTANLTGLAFSGGGIRSATFNLGIIQSLAKKNLLGGFDYLSTVSGGGYIGSWLSALLHRHANAPEATASSAGNKNIEDFQKSFSAAHPAEQAFDRTSGNEHPAIRWLRSYSNYLTPKKGISGDTLSAIGSWLRNTLLNQMALFLFFASLLLFPQLAVPTLAASGWLATEYANQWLLLSVVLTSCEITLCSMYLPGSRECTNNNADAIKKKTCQPTKLIILIAVIAAYCLSLWIYSASFWVNARADVDTPGIAEQLGLLDSFLHELPLIGDSRETLSPLLTMIQSYWSPVMIAGIWAIIYVVPWTFVGCRTWRKPWDAFLTILFAAASGAFGGWLIYELLHVVSLQNENIRLWWATGFGTPLLLVIFCLILMLHQGLMARQLYISQLEWWARMGGYVLLVAAAWAGVHILLIYAPPLLNMLENKFIAAGGVLWALHSLAGVLLGKSAATSGKGGVHWKELITRAAPYMFVLGYLIAISWAVHALIFKFGTSGTPRELNLQAPDMHAISPAGDYWAQHCIPLDCSLYHAPPTFGEMLDHAFRINNHADLVTLWLILAGGAVAFLVLAWRLDVNLFSIHHFYRNRLTRCYLGAGRGDSRMPDPFTGFDPCDDIRMAELKQRPLHLVNTAMNLVHNGNLAWQDRKAYSFTFSPVACGFEYPPNANQPGGGFYDSARYMGGVKLGTAMAASGAAASPNMGYHSSPAVAFLLTVFNVRLGHWCPNTEAKAINPCAIRRSSPALGGEYLLKELFGMTDDSNEFVYLSDGGHFENLGVYELVRRRCRYIMVVDAGQDEKRTFEDAANMMRKCYIDFGVTLDIRLESLRAAKEGNNKGSSETCYALGDIIYPPKEAGREGDWGVLLYIKPSLLQDIPEDIRQYARSNKSFPHQTTDDQFFDEAQFESYRHLGNYLMDKVLESVEQQKTPLGKSWHWSAAY